MAWPTVVGVQSSYKVADHANKAVTLQLVQQVSLQRGINQLLSLHAKWDKRRCCAQIHYYIECCLLHGLTLDETTVALQQLGVQERLTRISKLSQQSAVSTCTSMVTNDVAGCCPVSK